MLFAVGFVSQFVIGGLSGVMHAVVPVDTQHNDSYFIIAHFHYVLFGGTIFGLLAGIYFWAPKIFGRMLDERLGKMHFWLTFIGFNMTFFPMHFLGSGRDAAPLLHLCGRQRLGPLESRSFRLVRWCWRSSFLVFIFNAFKSIRHGELAGDDPWDAANPRMGDLRHRRRSTTSPSSPR